MYMSIDMYMLLSISIYVTTLCMSIVYVACVSDWLTADSDICVYVYDIMDDDTSAM